MKERNKIRNEQYVGFLSDIEIESCMVQTVKTENLPDDDGGWIGTQNGRSVEYQHQNGEFLKVS